MNKNFENTVRSTFGAMNKKANDIRSTMKTLFNIVVLIGILIIVGVGLMIFFASSIIFFVKVVLVAACILAAIGVGIFGVKINKLFL